VNEKVSWQDMVSKKGWVQVSYDKASWIPCPPIFPPSHDRESWAASFAQAKWEASGLKHGKGEVNLLASQLSSIHESTYSGIDCQLAWINLPDPRLLPIPVRVGIWESRGDRDAQLRSLTHADDPAAVEPPIVEAFSTERLGTGLKTLRYLRTAGGSGDLYAGLNYAFRSTERETDLRVFTACQDLGRLQRALPDIDEFVQGMTIVPRRD
jgi:hypothetical protein